ncbi:unnamed protein product [Prunus armeniaca]|uniref:RNase H type-1 domain-containing protein n=1 Tax=Prunus armeniaca TaxID=36596 RepID=A0A6J5URD3_PRUAR|nr:unnamed protein product [Prunus armeniaca]
MDRARIASSLDFTCWNIWKSHCKEVMEGCIPSPTATVIASSSAITDFLKAKAHTVAIRRLSVSPEQRIDTWCPPLTPKIKININTAWYVESQRGGIGLIARNHLGSFIAAKVCPVLQIWHWK